MSACYVYACRHLTPDEKRLSMERTGFRVRRAGVAQAEQDLLASCPAPYLRTLWMFTGDGVRCAEASSIVGTLGKTQEAAAYHTSSFHKTCAAMQGPKHRSMYKWEFLLQWIQES